MELINLMKKRRSIRKYSGEKIDEDKIEKILQAGFLAPRSRGAFSWEAVVVRNKEVLRKMVNCRVGTGKMLEDADCAIVMLGNPQISDVWTEDSVIALSNMHLMASSLGVGSCWIQGRNRDAENGMTTEEYLREILEFPKEYKLEAILSLGMPGESKGEHEPVSFPAENIHVIRARIKR